MAELNHLIFITSNGYITIPEAGLLGAFPLILIGLFIALVWEGVPIIEWLIIKLSDFVNLVIHMLID